MNEECFQLYKELINERRFYTNKAWETLKFFTTIYTAILSITILVFINLHEINQTSYVAIVVIFLPFSAMFISVIGWLNLKIEISRLYETVATLMKAEKFLGLHEEIDEENRFFKKDRYILPNYFVDVDEKIKSKDTECFIDWMLNQKGTYGKFYSFSTWLFRIYFAIALILFIILLALVVN